MSCNNSIFVLTNTLQPLMPTSSARARKLQDSGRAAVYRMFPYTIILKGHSNCEVQPVRLKIDPGSKETGIALLNETTRKIIFAMVLVHRGLKISENLFSRKGIRNNRRNRKTRYRKPGLPNRKKPEGWLAPSLLHRVLTTLTWVNRLRRYSPITEISMELAKFDLQKMENPEISGAEYQQGTLFGYEIKEYLLEKFSRTCIYCDARNVPLEIDHIKAKTNGGTNRVWNLGLSCRPCNEKKGKQDVRDFLSHDTKRLAAILGQLKRPLKDAAALNATRCRLYQDLVQIGLPLEVASGGRTKFNRIRQDYRKEHWIDAACVGTSGESVIIPAGMSPLIAKATGHGSRQMCRMDRFGFPRTSAKSARVVKGFRTGDMVKAVVPSGKNTGTYVGKVAIRSSGYFNIVTSGGTIQGVSFKHCHHLHMADGYHYERSSARMAA